MWIPRAILKDVKDLLLLGQTGLVEKKSIEQVVYLFDHGHHYPPLITSKEVLALT